jgi:hypothetical protein
MFAEVRDSQLSDHGQVPSWQCGGQGFESPQLHPSRTGRSPIEVNALRISVERSRQSSSHTSLFIPQRRVHRIGRLRELGRHDMAVNVHPDPDL